MSEKILRICHLYPDLLNLYGDRGNILCMRRRLEWRGIDAEVTEVTVGEQADFTQFDLFFIGGGQDFEQEVLLSDLKAGKGSEIKAAIADGKTFLTICGGYQMLGHTLADPDGEESGTPCTLRGLALLPTDTVFNAEKQLRQTHATAEAIPFAGAKLTGYEIHAGRTTVQGSPFCILADGTPEGCVQANVFGTYLHGLFDTGELTEKLTAFLCKKKGISPADAPLLSMEQYRQQQFDLLADGVRAALDMDAVYAAMGMDRKGGNRV